MPRSPDETVDLGTQIRERKIARTGASDDEDISIGCVAETAVEHGFDPAAKAVPHDGVSDRLGDGDAQP